MPNFTAKTKEELYPEEAPPKPGTSIPSGDFDGLRELGATEFFPRTWQYRHIKHTLKDLQRPGYFDGETRDRLRVGDEIHYCMQGEKKLPSLWERGIAVVETNPNSNLLPLILAGFVRYSQPIPWTGEKVKAA